MDDEQSQNTRIRYIAAGIVVLIGLGIAGAIWYHRASSRPESAPIADPAAVATPAPPPPPQTPEVQHPLAPEAGSDDQPAVALADSDGVIAGQLRALFGASVVEQWLNPESIARHLVATVDNLPRNTPLEKVRPVHAPAGPFGVERTVIDKSTGAERIVLSDANYARYDAAVAVLQKVDTTQLVAFYRHFYPLLQRAYEDLGYPDHYFNDRVVAAIDDMLKTPEVGGPITLVQPKVLYQFEDPALEQRSAGQKLLLRMGAAHALAVKAKLQELRAQIVAQAPARASTQTR